MAKGRSLGRYRVAVLLALIASLPVCVAWADDGAPGRFLVASRGLGDPNFARSVVLLLRHDAEGAMGVIVNRPTRVSPQEVLPDVDALADYPAPVFFGGPVMVERLLVLLRSDTRPADAEPVTGDVYVTASRTTIEALVAEDASPDRLRVFAGHAGWGPGQLDREIADGGWHVVPARMDDVFGLDRGPDWGHLIPDARPLSVDASTGRMWAALLP